MKENLKSLFNITYFTIQKNTEDVSSIDALRRPDAGGNSINWNVGHIIYARSMIFESLGAEPVIAESEAAPYRRGCEALEDSAYLPLETLKEYLEESQNRLINALDEVSEERLDEALPEGHPFPPAFDTHGKKVAFLQFHEAYHCGQIGLLRRVIGKDGVLA